MDIGYIKKREITKEMEEAYLDYAMSVIVSRALPDVRDGLKPVQRRILYAMWDSGWKSTARYKKCAAVVGEVLGKYHPHGDTSVYDALARMAQNFNFRYPLIDGQGNFGSMDGDSPAAMRYTEARLSKISEEMLFDIEKETVDFAPNYDGSRKEPTVLPSKLPQLLLNGTVGIAVGMATTVPPHNLRELVDGIKHLIDHPKATTEDLTEFIKGPDFPSGGIIYNKKDIIHAYATGKGPIVTRAATEITQNKKGAFQIIITEVTFQVNKASLVEKIADLVRSKRVEGIRDIRDESDRDGIRIVIDLKNDAYPKKILNKLFKYTDLQKSIHLNMLALVDNGIQPQVLSLKSILEHYIGHRKEIIRRRTAFDLRKAKERMHILEGLSKALNKIDAIISTIKKSADKEIAHKNLVKKFKFTDIQASAILEIKLQTLAGLERKKIDEELKEKRKLIKELESILKSPKKILNIIKNELNEIRNKYGDERRTKIISRKVTEFGEEDLVPEEETLVMLTHGGYIKRIPPKTYKVQKRGGKGILGMMTREEDVVQHLFSASTHDNILFFSNKGRVFQLKAYEIPQTSRIARGKAIHNLLQLSPQEVITAVIPIRKSDQNRFLVMTTKNGIIKKTRIEDFKDVRGSGIIAIRLRKGDTLEWTNPTSGNDNIMIVTAQGQAIRFNEQDVRPMGRTASGVTGIRLKSNDTVISTQVDDNKKELVLIITEKGFGKRTKIKHFKKQKRGGRGVKAAKITDKNGLVVSSKILNPEWEDIIIISKRGQVIRIPIKNIPTIGRATKGVRIMRLGEKDEVAQAASI